MSTDNNLGYLKTITAALDDTGHIAAMAQDTLTNSFLGVPVEICIATRSLAKTISAMVKLGIGPWGLYQFNEATVSDRRSFGEPDPYVINVAFAQHGPMIWEVMEPVTGAATLQKVLEQNEQALHHVAFDGSPLDIAQRRSELLRRGARPRLSGIWLDEVEFYFFETPGLSPLVLEAYAFPPRFSPKPDAWYPAAPPASDWAQVSTNPSQSDDL